MRMRERIAIKVNSYAKDDLGANIPTATTLTTVWAKVQPLRGNELKDIGRLAAKQMHLIIIRHRTDLTTDNFIVWESRTGDITLNIRSIQNRDERGQFLFMECEEGVQ